MRLLLTILIVAFSFVAFGQSKKEVNAELNKQYARSKASYDSLFKVNNTVQLEIGMLKNQLYWKGERYEHSIEEFNDARFTLAGNYRLLNEIGFDAETINKRDDIFKSSYPSIKYSFRTFSEENPKEFKLTSIEPIADLTKLKVKYQNEVLTKKIRECDSINVLNKQIVAEQSKYKEEVLNAITEFTLVQQKMDSCISDLIIKANTLANKWFEIKKQEDKESEKEYQKELEKAEKARRKGEIYFIAPRANMEVETPVLSMPTPDLREPELGRYPQMIKKDDSIIMDFVEESSEFPGGVAALKTYLASNLVLPEAVKKGDIQGRAIVKFIVSKEGYISQVKIVKGVPDCSECDAEAIRVVQEMPKWTPGKNNGKPVNQWFNLPVVFRISE